MYVQQGELLEYYKFIGWAENTSEFINKITSTSSVDLADIIKDVYNQAKKQARSGTGGYPDKYGCTYSKYYIKHRQEVLEGIAKAAMFEANKFTTKEGRLFVFGRYLDGVYVFKQVL